MDGRRHPRCVAEADEVKAQPVPDWAVKILQAAIRDYRYTGDYLPGTDTDRVVIGIRRASNPIGQVIVRHLQAGPKHTIQMVFESAAKGGPTETLAAHSLKQLQTMAPLLLERVCRYGCSLDRKWCDQCSQAERHLQGMFRAPPATAPAGPTGPAPA